MKKIRKSKLLSVVSPSANVVDNPECNGLIEKAKKNAKNINLNLKFEKNWNKKNKYISGSIKERTDDIHSAFLNKKVDAIISSQGGNNSNELLPFLDFDLIKKNWKPFFGLSDITVILNAIYAQTKKETYHGMDFVWGMGMNFGDFTKNQLESFFNGKNKLEKNKEYENWVAVRSGEGEGIIVGGCLPSFCLLLGTKYDPLRLNKPFILIIESIGESWSRTESYITQLSQNEFIKNCRGIVIGNFFLCKEEIAENDKAIEKIVIDNMKGMNFPIIKIKELGHATENIIFPIGRNIRIKAKKEGVEMMYE